MIHITTNPPTVTTNGKPDPVRLGPWKANLIFQQPTVGSRWYRGNFTLGLTVDSHPRFVNVILCLLFIEIGVGLTREYQDGIA